jgi:hypothetical protein
LVSSSMSGDPATIAGAHASKGTRVQHPLVRESNQAVTFVNMRLTTLSLRVRKIGPLVRKTLDKTAPTFLWITSWSPPCGSLSPVILC